MSRTKIKKPKEEQNPDPRLHSLYYTLNDLYVGAIVNLNSHHFLITAADEYVFSYMERESEKEKVNNYWVVCLWMLCEKTSYFLMLTSMFIHSIIVSSI